MTLTAIMVFDRLVAGFIRTMVAIRQAAYRPSPKTQMPIRIAIEPNATRRKSDEACGTASIFVAGSYGLGVMSVSGKNAWFQSDNIRDYRARTIIDASKNTLASRASRASGCYPGNSLGIHPRQREAHSSASEFLVPPCTKYRFKNCFQTSEVNQKPKHCRQKTRFHPSIVPNSPQAIHS